jgi:two-component system response regulator DevR
MIPEGGAMSDTATPPVPGVTVFVVDDDQQVRRAICEFLEGDTDLTVVGVAGSVADALERIPTAAPDVAVLPLRLADGSGIDLCRALLSSTPGLRCLMLAGYFSEETMLDSMLAGASGYLVKDLKSAELSGVIKDIAAGKSLLDNRGMAVLMKKLAARAVRATQPRHLYRRPGGFDFG